MQKWYSMCLLSVVLSEQPTSKQADWPVTITMSTPWRWLDDLLGKLFTDYCSQSVHYPRDEAVYGSNHKRAPNPDPDPVFKLIFRASMQNLETKHYHQAQNCSSNVLF